MAESIALRKCASFDTRHRKVHRDISQNVEKRGNKTGQNYECTGCKKMEKQINEHNQELRRIQDLMKEMLKEIKDLRGQSMREIRQNEECSIGFQQHVSCSTEASKEPGIDNGGYSSAIECMKQNNKSSGDNGNNQILDLSLGKI